MIDQCRLPLLALAALTVACSSPMSKFYTLSPTARPDPSAQTKLTVGVGPVTIPSAVDRPQFVLQVAPNRVTLQEYHRWAAPLGQGIAQTVASDLSAILGTPNIAPLPAPNFRYEVRVTIDVQNFQSVPDESVQIDAVWSVSEADDPTSIRSGRTVARETVDGPDFEALAAAHSRAVGQLSERIAKAIREEHPK